jgi:hypothetical protein
LILVTSLVLVTTAFVFGFVVDNDGQTKLTAEDRAVAESARMLLEYDTAVGRLSADPEARTREVILSAESVAERGGLIHFGL